MKLRRIWAIARKEMLHIVRDPRSLAMAVAIPMLLLLLFGYALTLDVDNVPLVVWDQSNTPASREFISGFTGSGYFSLAGNKDNYADIEQAIDESTALVGLIIPTDFADTVELLKPTHVQALVDGSDSNTVTIAIAYLDAISRIYTQDILLKEVRRVRGMTIKQPIDFQPRVWFNADLKSRNYIIPGLIAVIMMVIAALLTSLTIAREWEQGTMEQLISTPVKGRELIIGKMAPYFVIGMFDVLIAVLMGQFLYHVPLRGNVALLFAVSSIFLLGALSMGILISIVTKSQLLASQLAIITTFMPAFLLSGFMFAISNMPVVLQIVTHVVPARYFVAVLKGIYLKGVGLEVLGLDIVFLAIFATIVFALANRKLKKKLL